MTKASAGSPGSPARVMPTLASISAREIATNIEFSARAYNFSGGTNDTRQVNRHTLTFFSLAIFLLVPTIAAVVGLFVADSLLIKSVAATGVLGCTMLAWAAYMRLFNRGRIDLLSRAR